MENSEWHQEPQYQRFTRLLQHAVKHARVDIESLQTRMDKWIELQSILNRIETASCPLCGGPAINLAFLKSYDDIFHIQGYCFDLWFDEGQGDYNVPLPIDFECQNGQAVDAALPQTGITLWDRVNNLPSKRAAASAILDHRLDIISVAYDRNTMRWYFLIGKQWFCIFGSKALIKELLGLPAKANIAMIKTKLVYLIQSGPLYKIGVSVNPKSRLMSLSTASPNPLRLVWSKKYDDAYAVEKELHDQFNSKRINGEWFRLDEKDVETIKAQ